MQKNNSIPAKTRTGGQKIADRRKPTFYSAPAATLCDCLQSAACGKSYKLSFSTLISAFLSPHTGLFPPPAPVTAPVSDQTSGRGGCQLLQAKSPASELNAFRKCWHSVCCLLSVERRLET